MASADYDLIIIGGGVGGSGLATAMAVAGARVLVVERETAFSDRIRGEWVAPWGVAETQKLGSLQPSRAKTRRVSERRSRSLPSRSPNS